MELVGEQQAPGGLEFGGRGASPQPGGGRPQLGGLQGGLAPAVAPLDGRLAGEGGPVLLQVEVADHVVEVRRGQPVVDLGVGQGQGLVQLPVGLQCDQRADHQRMAPGRVRARQPSQVIRCGHCSAS